MAPSKASRANHEDAKSETAGTKDKNGHSGGHHANGKHRHSNSVSGSQARDAAAAAATGAAASSAPATKEAPKEQKGMQWNSLDRDILHSYRREHRIDTPTSFISLQNHRTLTQPGGVGLYSPTMARRKGARRQTREQLAQALRKHFNALGVQESDVVVEFLHKLRVERDDKAKAKRMGSA